MQRTEFDIKRESSEQIDIVRDGLSEIYSKLQPDHIACFLPDVDFSYSTYKWEDPVWGPAQLDETWGGIDEDDNSIDYTYMFKALFLHPAIKRLIGIEQLTLPSQYETLPNTARFSRWEHITGSALLVKQLVDNWNTENPTDTIGNRQKVIYILRTMLSDVGHTIGSHLGDWIMDDQHEKEHDVQLKEYIEQNGIDEILEQFNIDLNEVILTEVDEEDFVERPSPYLCIDRVDYATREIHRTNRYFDEPNKRFTIEDFRLVKVDGAFQMVMDSPQRALEFAKAYELLTKEDWSEPLQRLQTTIYTELIKVVLIAIANGQLRTPIGASELRPFEFDGQSTTWISESDKHPRDVLMYAEAIIGATIKSAYDMVQYVNSAPMPEILQTICDLDYIMRSISEIAKTHYHNTRSDEVVEFMNDVSTGVLGPNAQIKDRDILYTPSFIELVKGSGIVIDFGTKTDYDNSDNQSSATVTLAERKKRVIDPTISVDGRVKQLSQVSAYTVNSDAYSALSARLIFETPELADSLNQAKNIIEAEWESLLSRDRLSARQLQDMQRSPLTGFIAATDYWQFTRRGALEEENKLRTLRLASEWAAANKW